jgi:hypothetical protein
MDASIKKEVLDRMEELSDEKQKLVLNILRSLTPRRPRGTPGRDLLDLAGLIDAEDLRLMSEAIEEGCERIDPNAW